MEPAAPARILDPPEGETPNATVNGSLKEIFPAAAPSPAQVWPSLAGGLASLEVTHGYYECEMPQLTAYGVDWYGRLREICVSGSVRGEGATPSPTRPPVSWRTRSNEFDRTTRNMARRAKARTGVSPRANQEHAGGWYPPPEDGGAGPNCGGLDKPGATGQHVENSREHRTGFSLVLLDALTEEAICVCR
jgi:hypothetical protein